MPDPTSSDHPVDELAEELARRWRSGERPSVEEYAARYPQWEDWGSATRKRLPAASGWPSWRRPWLGC